MSNTQQSKVYRGPRVFASVSKAVFIDCRVLIAGLECDAAAYGTIFVTLLETFQSYALAFPALSALVLPTDGKYERTQWQRTNGLRCEDAFQDLDIANRHPP
jgi:hypothetical protein